MFVKFDSTSWSSAFQARVSLQPRTADAAKIEWQFLLPSKILESPMEICFAEIWQDNTVSLFLKQQSKFYFGQRIEKAYQTWFYTRTREISMQGKVHLPLVQLSIS